MGTQCATDDCQCEIAQCHSVYCCSAATAHFIHFLQSCLSKMKLFSYMWWQERKRKNSWHMICGGPFQFWQAWNSFLNMPTPKCESWTKKNLEFWWSELSKSDIIMHFLYICSSMIKTSFVLLEKHYNCCLKRGCCSNRKDPMGLQELSSGYKVGIFKTATMTLVKICVLYYHKAFFKV